MFTVGVFAVFGGSQALLSMRSPDSHRVRPYWSPLRSMAPGFEAAAAIGAKTLSSTTCEAAGSSPASLSRWTSLLIAPRGEAPVHRESCAGDPPAFIGEQVHDGPRYLPGTRQGVIR